MSSFFLFQKTWNKNINLQYTCIIHNFRMVVFMYSVFIDWGYGIGEEVFSSYKIGEKLYNKLELSGISVGMRPITNTVISLEERISLIEHTKADILICIDSNWSENANQKGIETYYNASSIKGELLAKKVQRELIKATNLYNRGIISYSDKTNPSISSLLKANETSIVTLIGFYSNPHERLKIEQDMFKERASLGILNGIKKLYKTKGIFM